MSKIGGDRNQTASNSVTGKPIIAARCVDQPGVACKDTKTSGVIKGRRVVSSGLSGSVVLRYAPQRPVVTQDESSSTP